MNKSIKRNSNIEILRIISIFMIILSHYTVHNSVVNSSLALSFNRLLLEISTLGNLGVVIFIIITGYFSVENKMPFSFKKLLSLLLEVFCYSICIYFLFIIFGNEEFNFKIFIKVFFPLTFNEYWFISAYVLLYIFTPFINIFLNNLDRKRYLLFLLVILVVFSIYGIVTKYYYSNSFIEFILFYSIGGYIKKNPKNIFNSPKNTYILLISCILLLVSSTLLIDLIGTRFEVFNNYSIYFFNRMSPLTILLAISLFNIFNNKNFFANKYINYVSSCVFGVYLIHDNPFIRKVLWLDILDAHEYVDSNFLIIHMFLSVILVFLTCLIIEIIRKKTIQKIVDIFIKKVNNFENLIYNKYSNYYTKMLK